MLQKSGKFLIEKIQKFLKACIKMEKASINFGDIEIQKQKFLQHKGRISIKNIDINKVVITNMVSFGKKKEFAYFIGNKDAKKSRPLCIFLPKMTAYRKDLLLEKYNKILENVKNSFKKNLIVNQSTMENI